MTDKEKAIVMAHTGICMLTGDKFQIFHKYVEDIMKRPIMTHEMGYLADEIKEKSKADFIALCANESSSENPNNSITKNDLEVECIDRQATLDAIIKRLGIKNESYLLPAEKTIYQQIKDMPSVTPIRPKGHWIDTNNLDVKYKAIYMCSNCRSCYTEMKPINMNFCPNCGADMREVRKNDKRRR